MVIQSTTRLNNNLGCEEGKKRSDFKDFELLTTRLVVRGQGGVELCQTIKTKSYFVDRWVNIKPV